MSAQPVWKFVDNLGDASPIDYGGLFLYRDETGVYAPELERLDCDHPRYEIHRVCLDKCAEVNGHVIHDLDFARANPAKYEEWFSDSLDSVAATMGTTRAAIVEGLCSDDIKARALAYMAIYDHHGWDNVDSDPLQMSRPEVWVRYAEETGNVCKESGYTQCACRDCMDIAIGDAGKPPPLCSECQEAGCDPTGEAECSREPEEENEAES